MSSLILRTCEKCGHQGRYRTQGLAKYHFARHSCAKQFAVQDAAKAAVERESQIDRTPQPCNHKQARHEHGTYVAYKLDNCRCLPCSAAHSDYAATLARDHAYGRARLVDAEPIRQHIRDLSGAGVGLKRITALTGINGGVLSKLMYGTALDDGSRRPPSRRITRANASKILAVKPEHVAPGALVPAVGTARRVQALMACGWSLPVIAARAGVDRQALDAVLRGHREMVQARTAKLIGSVFEVLWDVEPPADTRGERVARTRAIRRATAAGWVPPMAWDDGTIDDPDASPSVTALAARGVDLDEWLYLVRAGESLEHAARRLGVSLGAIERAGQRQGRGDVLAPIVADRAERSRNHVIPANRRRRAA